MNTCPGYEYRTDTPPRQSFYWVTRLMDDGRRVTQNAFFGENGWNVKGVIAWIEYPAAYSGEV